MITRVDADHYWAVIFTSHLPEADDAYARTSERMLELAASMPGFLGIESVRGPDGYGITISYWTDEEAIANWRNHAEHRVAQASGRSRWYAEFSTRVCRVERTSYYARE